MYRKMIALIVAAMMLFAVSVVGASPASATEPNDCVPTDDVYAWFVTDPGSPWEATGKSRVKTEAVPDKFTDWVNEGDQIRTETKDAPADPDGETGEDNPKNLAQIVYVGETAPEVVTPAVEGKHYSWNGGNRGVDNPPTVIPPHADWQVQGVGFDPHLQGGGTPATWYPVDPATSGLHVVGNSPSNASWFYYVPGTPAVTDVDYLWQKQVRTFVPGSEAVIEYEYVKKGNDCPPDEPQADRGIDTVHARTSSYQCDDDFKTVTTFTWTTPWMLVDGEKVYGDTIKTVEKDRVKVDVVPCKTDKPDEPNKPVATPEKPKHKAAPAVPVSVDAGLAPVAQNESVDSGFDLGDLPYWAVGLFLVAVIAVLVRRALR